MSKHTFIRKRQQQINILHATTQKRRSRKEVVRALLWVGGGIGSLAVTALTAHLLVGLVMKETLYENPRFTLKTIRVEAREGAPRRQIVQAAKVMPGQNIMRFDLKQIQANVERLPYVSEAVVERQLPDTLVIKITERQPLARLVGRATELGAAEVFYIDREGVVLRPRPGEALRNLPEITGLRITEFEPGQRLDQKPVLAALNLLKMMELTPLRASLDISAVDVSPPLALQASTAQGGMIQFQYDHQSQQLQRLTEITDWARQRQRHVRTVDLTLNNNVPVTFFN